MNNKKITINLYRMKNQIQKVIKILSEVYFRTEQDKELKYFEYTFDKNDEDKIYKVYITKKFNNIYKDTYFVTILDYYNRIILNGRDILYGDHEMNIFYYDEQWRSEYEFYLSAVDSFKDNSYKDYPVGYFRVNNLEINNLLVAIYDENGTCRNIQKEDFLGYDFDIFM